MGEVGCVQVGAAQDRLGQLGVGLVDVGQHRASQVGVAQVGVRDPHLERGDESALVDVDHDTLGASVGHISLGCRVYVVKDPTPADVTRNESENVMNVMMIRAQLKAESLSESEAAADKMFAAINAIDRRMTLGTQRGISAVAVLALEDPADNQLQAIPEFREFQEQLPEWLAEPPIVEPLMVIGSYDLF